MKQEKINFLTKQAITAFLVICLAIPASLALLPKKAEADTTSCAGYVTAFAGEIASDLSFGFFSVPSGDHAKAISQATISGNSLATFLLNCVVKPLALAIAKAMLQQMTNQMVAWISGGFNGSPGFIQDPGAFFQNVVDQGVGQFILGGSLKFLCSPFQLQVRLALALNYSASFQSSRCTLSQIVSNIDNFFNQDFTVNGWAGWLSMTQSPQNNPYGSYLEAGAYVASANGQKVNLLQKQLNWGNGFLSYQVCTDQTGATVPDPKTYTGDISVYAHNGIDYDSAKITCKTTTPGHTIATALDNQLKIPGDQLGVADDLDKIFNALANEVLSQGIGLLGLGPNKNGNGLTGLNNPGTSGKSQLQENQEAAAAAAQAAQTNSENDKNAVSKGINDAGTQEQGQNGGEGNGGTNQATNVALGKIVNVSSILPGGHSPSALVNGDRSDSQGDTYSGASTKPEADPWFEIDLAQPTAINKIDIFQRTNPGGESTTMNFTVSVLDENMAVVWKSPIETQDFVNPILLDNLPANTTGRYVKIEGTGPGRLELAEVEVIKSQPPVIKLVGSPALSVNVADAGSYSDPGATATDGSGTDISSQIQTTGLPIGTTQGTYTITYNVTDASTGLSATPVTRTVIVQ